MQKALDSLLKIYLQKETRAELGGSNKNNAEAYQFGIEEEPIQPQEEEEFLQALYKCLEEKGVMREMQAFLRQKLVNILKGVWPNLVSTQCEGNLGRVTTMLIEDFMCSHKLLFTYSVLATELDEGVTSANKGNFGKMKSTKAEALLADIGIKKHSKLSRTILKSYSENTDWSLIECIIDSTAWSNPKNEPPMTVNELNMANESEKKQVALIDEKMRQINEKYFEKTKNVTSASIEEKLKNLTEAMELEKDAEIEIRIEKFRQEEAVKIRDEIETKLKFEILQKEKELLRNFENQVTHLKRSLKREKQVWMIERNRKEKELSETRQELVKALMTLKTDENLKREDQKSPKEDSVDSSTMVEPNEEPTTQKTKPKTKRDLNGPEIEENKLPEKYSSTILNAVNVKKELEREFLLKEASLRNAIDKLKTENEWLKLKKNEPVQGSGQPIAANKIPEVFYERPRQMIQQSPQPSENHFADTIALMKYKIESQSEEIEKLRQNLDAPRDRSIDLTNLPVPSRVQLHPARTSSDIDNFLEQSKRRFAEIDHEARTVELTINAIQGNQRNLRSNRVENKTSTKFGPEIPRLPPPYRNSSLFLETNARRYEYFPKYLNPALQKPPPIKEYKPKLGSDLNPVKHFGLPPPEFFLGSTTSSLVGTNQIVTTNSNSTVSVPAILGIQVLSDSKISDKESKTENYTNTTQGGISATEFGREVSDDQISENTGQTREFQKRSDTRDRISVEISPSLQQDSAVKSSASKVMHVEKRADSKIPENNNNGLAKSKSNTITNGHQQKASASGALVKDKLSAASALNELAKADLSESSMSIHSNKSVIQKSEEIVQPTWRDILKNSASNMSLLDSNQVKESIADIGHIETGDQDDDDAEDFWDI